MSKVLDLRTERVKVEDILIANQRLKEVCRHTPLEHNPLLSDKYGCQIHLKREDLQVVRSFKIRGAYHTIISLPEEERQQGVVCASAGNHAQGVSYSCNHLKIPGKIFMPTTTPRQKINQVKHYGGKFVEVVLTGDTFDDAYHQAVAYAKKHHMSFIHPFDDYRTIVGQGTIGIEILNDLNQPPDYVFVAIGGGGLAAGISSYIKSVYPQTKVIGVEPAGAPGMKTSFENGKVTELKEIDPFVDGAAVKHVGELTFQICRENIDEVVLVPEGKICTTILNLYNQNAIIAEPAGALAISALDFYREAIRGKNVVCIMSGGNNDIDRMQEIKERSLIYEGLKHYFIINFPQRAGALREFLDDVLGENDDITRFEYTKKNNKDNGPALVGIELKYREDYPSLIERMKKKGFPFIEINNDPRLFHLLI
ncbi:MULTISPECIES: threonine ammonia-lyase IlvA [Thermoactinomyces]|jgi:threonine dehydratase|uniref:L-threonine dehydratase n=1 Tax=Thermoactinomyces vulgaris TaxID=2026 RepID=A0ABS0QI66_THEVU|nr:MULTISPECIES: threonine ammonia-lyase IlvA [Thermoactinomyces]MBA4551577.1 threonine ammonia-lyase IlvA [Thermoactinomyces vulgaris]MBA4596544.1 threonine ammonia-lyase IlvA [Thermoactinomyces vulgaris]MBH8588747.1 threonine ammonia-lyase IlvA [Thermoactinomyces vulgaris]MBI0391760.1 threonine ammonia-lyase IlvA [Thermoactinomyces sp. CICC 24226]QCV55261.1 threonine ammonia-lyase IlvA [Thermoactinomyces vulgaris]